MVNRPEASLVWQSLHCGKARLSSYWRSWPVSEVKLAGKLNFKLLAKLASLEANKLGKVSPLD